MTALKQNIPNPFSTRTKIGYTVSSPGLVSLAVFDVLGNEVCELVNERKATGFYEVEFNPSGYPGIRTSGNTIFICRLLLNDRVESRRMVLIK